MKNLETKDKLFGIFFIIFFAVLVIMIRTGNANNDGEFDDQNNTSSGDYDEIIEDEDMKNMYSGINNKNYEYTYTINIDNHKEIITGKAFNNKEKFSIISNGKEEYAILSGNYLKLENNNYKVVDKINDYYKYLDLNIIKKLILLSETEDETDQYIVYKIDITDLIDEYNFDVEYDGFEEYKPDRATYYLNKNGTIDKIVLDYSEYYTYVTKKQSTMVLTLEFSNYGKVVDFEI